MIWCAYAYSRFWKDYAALFVFGTGMLLSYMTGLFNLMSCAKGKFNPIFYDPFVFWIILYFDYNGLLSSEVLAILYIVLVLVRIIFYILLMRSTVIQICDYMDLNFITVKEKKVDTKGK